MSTSPNTIYGLVVACDVSANLGYPINGGLATAFLVTFSLQHTDKTGLKNKKSPPTVISPYMLGAPRDTAEQPFVLNAAKVLLDSYFNGRVVSFQPSLTQNLPYVEASTVQ